jgi:hypothetical protein
MTANHHYMSLSSLRRRPVLIALVMYSVAYGAATFAVWRETSSISTHRNCEMVQSSAQSVGATEEATDVPKKITIIHIVI